MTHFPHHPTPRPTETYPVVQRTGIRFFRRMSRGTLNAVRKVGAWTYFMRDIGRALSEPSTYLPETLRQMKNIGVDSVPLTVIVAGFIGSVIALQTRYQLFPGVQLSLVGLATRQMVILELGPLLTGLVLAGRVGARMTAEIGTMRVTEQIDALETLAYDPVAFLVLPRLLAAVIMLPVLTVLANAVGVSSGYLMGVHATGISPSDFKDGLRLGFGTFQVVYSLLKATMFGGAISFFSSYEGYIAQAGAEGVGRSTANAVVITSVAILVLDALTAVLLAPYLQS
ncbi:MAG: ABC transporter permease [Gemmatimonadota bacterium]|nr:ABC transporter permease [Gemmatimonadota bacterium]HEU4990549.1 ABC transporter permease [Gemmatimonadaceae bacterium]